MRLYGGITAFFLLLLSVTMLAGPVGESNAAYYQPDGTSFNVKVTGDEWIKIRTTEDGCSITKDDDGWWCYAKYDQDGKISSTGYRIGNAPAHILAEARNIPYEKLSQIAAEKRAIGAEQGNQRLEKMRQQAIQTKSGSTHIQNRGLALLVQFSDVKFRYRKEDFINLLNQKNYNGTGSAKDYYEYQFGEGWEFHFDVSDIITLNFPSEHYGKNDNAGQDIRPWDMVVEACIQADSQIDFSQYDQDGDDCVDNVYVFYAGLSEAENTKQPDLIWPHQYYVYSGTAGKRLTLDGKLIDRYACSSEISGISSLTGIGSFCHEYGHTFGLMDLYDTDYDNKGGWAPGTWRSTSLMDGGNYNNNSATPPNFNCIEREMLGLSQAQMLEVGKTYTLEPIHHNGTFYRLNTNTQGEYYLFECRSNECWDRYIGGNGLLVYHIDKNLKTTIGSHNAWSQNEVNCVLAHQGADLIEADGRPEEITSTDDLKMNISGIFFPTSRVTSIGTDGAPQLKYWNGDSSYLAITGIKRSNSNIVFNVVDKLHVSGVPSVMNINYTSFPDAALITFEASDTTITDVKAVLEWKRADIDEEYKVLQPTYIGKGKYVCMLDGLTSGNITYEAFIHFETEEVISASYKCPFMTKRKPSVEWPYIYISGATTKRGTGLPLHIVNSAKAAEISWSYDDISIIPDADYKFRPSKSGILKATIIWPDGSSDIITKKLTVIE